VFPLSVNGSVRLELASAPTEITVKAAVDRIAATLRRDNITDIRVVARTIEFGAGLRRWFTNWKIDLPYGRGVIRVEPHDTALRISYDLSTRQLLILVTLAVAALATLPLLAGGGATAFQLFGLFWAVMFGTAYIFAILRFPRLLRKGLSDLPELKAK
jgi:hypothetical protein